MASSTVGVEPTVEVDGWVRLPGLMTPAEVRATLDRCDELLTRPPTGRETGDKPSAGTRHLFGLDRRSPEVAALMTDSRVVDAVDRVLGPDARLEQASFRCPQPGYGAQKLHADDLPRLDDSPSRVATAIVALVDFTDTNGATRIVPGSHRRPDLQRSSGSLDGHPDEIQLVGPAGTGFVFDGHLLHSGTLNRSDHERPALQITWRRR